MEVSSQFAEKGPEKTLICVLNISLKTGISIG